MYKSTIFLHGQAVQTMATSVAALRRMRLRDKSRTLWIDSICIDPDNTEEKGHQVGMMYEIYTKTFLNLIWMGPYDSTWTKAFDQMRAILQEIADETRNYTDLRELVYSNGKAAILLTKPFTIDVHTNGFDFPSLFDNPWFSRLWVVQEAALAPLSVCHYGEFEVSLLDILRSARWLIYKFRQLPDISRSTFRGIYNAVSMGRIADRYYGKLHTCSFATMSDCLESLSNSLHTFDRRDCVFAVLAVWQLLTKAAVVPDILKPDYTLSVRDVFTGAVKFAIKESHSLSLLEQISEPSKEPQDSTWPSWVPVLDHYVFTKDAPWPLEWGFHTDYDSMTMEVIDDIENPNDLVVSGVLLDSIAESTPAFTPSLKDWEVDEMLSALELSNDESWVKNPAGGLEAKIGLVLMGGCHTDDTVTAEEALDTYQSFKRRSREHGVFPANGHWADSFMAARYRAVFRTKDGHLGVGPGCMQPGDVVGILYGCSLPVVLRPLPDQHSYSLLGMSYVYGIMKGEAVRVTELWGEKTSCSALFR